MIRVTPRVAAKFHRCECGKHIPKGTRYLLHVASPGGDLGFDSWQRCVECEECATRYGRGDLFAPAGDPVREGS